MRHDDDDSLPFQVAVLASVLLTGALFLLAIAWLSRPPPTLHRVKPPTMVRLLQLPAPVLPAPTLSAPSPPPPLPAPLLDLPRMPAAVIAAARKHAALRPHPRAADAAHDVSRRALATSAAAAHAATSSPRAGPASPPSDRAARDSLEGRIRQAIQAAYRYPEAARIMGDQGTVMVGFDYRDRVLSSLRILQSSNFPVLDRAALEIVRAAAMPPPGALAGTVLSLEVPVVFHAVSEDE